MSTRAIEYGEELYEGTFRGTYNGDRVIIKKYDLSKLTDKDKRHTEWEENALNNINTRYVIHRIDSFEKDGYKIVVVEDISETLRYYLDNFKNRQSIVKETVYSFF